ncbi:4'-phosphopantetheinyl transferase superfamily protein [Streptomyces sp. NBC_01116]|uniref:4'-phosphopantetheinyl transferase family protein n=1 Tax=Streptomyces sp. NBC_01116 TaxID=2903752 RepID=UPI00325448ED
MTPARAAATDAVECEPGIWFMTRQGTAPAPGHPDDLADASGLADWRAAEFLAGRALLRELLAATVPEAADDRVTLGRNGKPGLATRPDLGISIAHDRGHVAACVAVGRAVGIDVQLPAEKLSDGLVRKCVRRGRERLDALPHDDRAREFAWIWTVQEACVKAEGSGLAGGPWTVDVTVGETSGRWKGFRWRSLRDRSDIPLSCAWELL